MPTTRTTYKYYFKVGNEIVHTGVTGNIFLRESELQREFGDGRIEQVGLRTTRDAAIAWKREQLHRNQQGEKRDTHKYNFRAGDRVVHTGITNDLERREAEHQNRWKNGYIEQVGRRTTRDAAFKWEAEQRKKGKLVGP